MGQQIDPTDVIAVTCWGTYQGQNVLNVFHYTNSLGTIVTANGDAELTKLCENFRDRVWNPVAGAWRDLVCTGYSLNYIVAQKVSLVRQYYVNKNVGQAGLSVGDGVPSDVNLTISLRTARAIRGTTGNKKFTGSVLGVMAGNVWNPATILAWGDVALNIRQTLQDVGAVDRWVPIVWSPARPTERSEIVGHTVQPEVRVLRRRQYGKGI